MGMKPSELAKESVRIFRILNEDGRDAVRNSDIASVLNNSDNHKTLKDRPLLEKLSANGDIAEIVKSKSPDVIKALDKLQEHGEALIVDDGVTQLINEELVSKTLKDTDLLLALKNQKVADSFVLKDVLGKKSSLSETLLTDDGNAAEFLATGHFREAFPAISSTPNFQSIYDMAMHYDNGEIGKTLDAYTEIRAGSKLNGQMIEEDINKSAVRVFNSEGKIDYIEYPENKLCFSNQFAGIKFWQNHDEITSPDEIFIACNTGDSDHDAEPEPIL